MKKIKKKEIERESSKRKERVRDSQKDQYCLA